MQPLEIMEDLGLQGDKPCEKHPEKWWDLPVITSAPSQKESAMLRIIHAQNRASNLCVGCPLMRECAEYALDLSENTPETWYGVVIAGLAFPEYARLGWRPYYISKVLRMALARGWEDARAFEILFTQRMAKGEQLNAHDFDLRWANYSGVTIQEQEERGLNNKRVLVYLVVDNNTGLAVNGFMQRKEAVKFAKRLDKQRPQMPLLVQVNDEGLPPQAHGKPTDGRPPELRNKKVKIPA